MTILCIFRVLITHIVFFLTEIRSMSLFLLKCTLNEYIRNSIPLAFNGARLISTLLTENISPLALSSIHAQRSLAIPPCVVNILRGHDMTGNTVTRAVRLIKATSVAAYCKYMTYRNLYH